MADATTRPKLLIVITKSNLGGAQRYVYDLARSLGGRYETTVACGGEGVLVEKLTAAGIRAKTLPFLGRDVNPLNDVRSLFSLVKLIRTEKPDILHLNSSKIGILGALAAKAARSKAKVVFTAHAWAFNEDRGAIAKALIMAIHWLTVALCDRTLAVSEAVRSQMLHLPLMEKKIQAVHLGLEKPVFYGKKNARMVLGIPEKAFAIGTIAELHPVKGLSYALDALSEASFPFSYTIIGTGDLKESLARRISGDPRLAASAKLAGFIPDAAALLPAFDALLLPSLSEAFGYVLLEAGYAGIPVVASSVGGIPEVIEDMKSGVLIHAKNPKEILRALSFLEADPTERKRLGSALKERVEKEFSLGNMVEATKAAYAE